ncbi:predicted protein [Aspergillus nidulans FGSC A4]|uniref:Uncharacterized protein n=1 Tax=Emericella nidulans (strain FGSC A4 / ATCC 38163 / CBS 112.46 / NRRL 194 / M139) TaxID=227321 RepID=Q5BGE1_EMENI|nr:hypothetical protein [Aspergillus nidulans FGSC A4]EAA66488.1 predicted protein [Aspergillus nidulans FGSC A4]CBF89581.1 TPA: conserved hypothetical protein [Aspergillus nidulans FGSC A4]|eukprot:XP_657993.1 predicted protein [Aspergillus nidulans FGSC A4]
MTEASMPCDVPNWGFDLANSNSGSTFNYEPGVAGDEELWYRNQFGVGSFDVPPWQPMEMNQGYDFASPASGKTRYQQLPPLSPAQNGGFSARSEGLSPRYGHGEVELPKQRMLTLDGPNRFENVQTENSPYSLDDLLRTASQVATERALYMNIPSTGASTAGANALSPTAEPGISSPGAISSHHSIASDTDEHDLPAFDVPQVYQLPDFSANSNANAAGSLASRDLKETSLTPLEMPDGTTRFTANWLPVDPEGGFTIRPPSHHALGMDLDPMLMDHQVPLYQDHGQHHYNYRNAFISLDNLGGEAGV